MLIHTGEKIYKVSLCENSFGRSDKLKIHSCMHSGEKRYKFSDCSMSFSHSDRLKHHIRVERNLIFVQNVPGHSLEPVAYTFYHMKNRIFVQNVQSNSHS